MSDIKLDSTGDIEVKEGEISLTSGVEAIDQHLLQRMRTFLAEWFLDIRVGIPFFQHILVKRPNPTVIDTILKREIIETPGIIELLEFDIDFEPATREATLIFKAQSTEGPIDFTRVLGA